MAVQNEKRKDKEVTERVEKLLKRRDEVTKGVDLGAKHSGYLPPLLMLMIT